eukprot:CAMPEP_0119309326 /NCGR_PEP_ID=MMETSP1333-20130426/14964_1 /TAXON_ID=418940 /ORGANISM="Scyphosphaera apsteinii, Strain RCC1455" /LENGTH=414 /DNA_ID=CAMNT_0007313279 /DNA_START=75 /DNA_END=1319 /DNA_ORIENTATION=-
MSCHNVTTWWKPPLYSAVQALLGPFMKASGSTPIDYRDGVDRKAFIVSFCGSGTGHLTQALTVVKLLEKQGMRLAGIVTDTDATKRMLDEMVAPLGVEVLTLPAITLVDGQTGMVPLPLVFWNIVKVKRELFEREAEIGEFLSRCRPGLILSFWLLPLAYFMMSHTLPKMVKVLHIAPQFAHRSLVVRDLKEPIVVITKSTMDFMSEMFAKSGQCVPIASNVLECACLPPILEVPVAVQSWSERLILCYFLVQSDAHRLERIIHKHPMAGVQFECFTAQKLDNPKDCFGERELSIKSHQKQRKKFQELFDKCTGIIVSSGNETIWEAVCRGVPVLTIPTNQHGEQLLNAAAHSRNFPALVRARDRLEIDDIRWLCSYQPTTQAHETSSSLRKRCTALFSEVDSSITAVFHYSTL